MTQIAATRYHDFSCGHRVHGHESKCANFHGHNYRVTFTVQMMTEQERLNRTIPVQEEMPMLDEIGRVMDFSVIKTVLCDWLEEHWDHNFLMWDQDPYWEVVRGHPGFIAVPFNPTAENMGQHLLDVVGPALLADHGVKLIRVIVEETRKCSAEVSLS